MPTSVLALVLLLCFATPGIIFEILRERSRPARKYSVLRETGLIVVGSVCFTLPAAGILLAVGFVWQEWLPDFPRLADKPKEYAASHLPQVVLFVVGVVAVAVLLAVIADYVSQWIRPPRSRISSSPSWFEVIDGVCRPDSAKAVIISVELKNGASVQGSVKGYEWGVDDHSLAWLVLQKHSKIQFASRTPDGKLTQIPAGWAYIVIQGNEVRTATVAYVNSEE